MKRLLVVDDEPIMGDFLCAAGEREGYTVTRADSIRTGREKVGTKPFDVAFLDIRLPDGDGLGLVVEVRSKHPRCHICVITAYGTVDTAVSAMKLGANDFLLKPFSFEDVERVLARTDRPAKPETGYTQTLVTRDPKMKELLDLVMRIAPTDAGVLISGESGTGKELIARTLHHTSHRSDFPFVAVNCSAIPENLLEAELFGYERGAFTGAERRKLGLVEIAGSGTLFLDEIAELPIALQPKLLRVLEGGEFRRVGGQETLRADIRVIAATNKNLLELSKKNQFREDLYYRLSVIPIEIPPLRCRPDDIGLLTEYFLKEYSRRYARDISHVAPTVLDVFQKYPWPGNVRELENVIQRAVALADGDTVRSVSLPVQSQTAGGTVRPEHLVGAGKPYDELVDEFERGLIAEALRRTAGNQTDAADLLGIKRTTLVMKLKKFVMDSSSG